MLAKIQQSVEQSVFFPVVRTVTFICALLLFLAMLGGILFCFVFIGTYDSRENAKVRVSFADVANAVYPDGAAGSTGTRGPAGSAGTNRIRIPENVEK